MQHARRGVVLIGNKASAFCEFPSLVFPRHSRSLRRRLEPFLSESAAGAEFACMARSEVREFRRFRHT